MVKEGCNDGCKWGIRNYALHLKDGCQWGIKSFSLMNNDGCELGGIRVFDILFLFSVFYNNYKLFF